MERIKNQSDIIYSDNKNKTIAIFENKHKILELSNEFNALERDFENFECSNCKSNLKNTLFLPCGHIVICNDCLLNDYNITPNLPIVASRLRCMKCTSIVTQALMSVNFMTSD